MQRPIEHTYWCADCHAVTPRGTSEPDVLPQCVAIAQCVCDCDECVANRAAKRAADIIQVAAQHGMTMEDAAVFVDETRVRGLARLARAAAAAEAAAHQAEVAAANAAAIEAAAAEATEADVAALDELQAALDAALEAAGTHRPDFTLHIQSDNTSRQFRCLLCTSHGKTHYDDRHSEAAEAEDNSLDDLDDLDFWS